GVVGGRGVRPLRSVELGPSRAPVPVQPGGVGTRRVRGIRQRRSRLPARRPVPQHPSRRRLPGGGGERKAAESRRGEDLWLGGGTRQDVRRLAPSRWSSRRSRRGGLLSVRRG